MMPDQRFALLKPLAVGAIPVVCTIFTHAFAVLATVSLIRHERRLGRTGASTVHDLLIVLLTMTFALAAHLLEVAWWAVVFIFCGEFRRVRNGVLPLRGELHDFGIWRPDYDASVEIAGTAGGGQRNADVRRFHRVHFCGDAKVGRDSICGSAGLSAGRLRFVDFRSGSRR